MNNDLRHISAGSLIPTENYSDQPYVVKTDDGAWLCVVTTGTGHEGDWGQHVITRRSTDRGMTWEDSVEVEPADAPESSYAVLLKGPTGRIFCFYNHNTDNLRAVRADLDTFPEGLCKRVDSLGHFVFKYSDDHGRSWSAERIDIPQRAMAIDRANAYKGEVKFFWNVGRAFAHQGCAYVPLNKVGGFGHGFFTSDEGILLCSPDLLTAADPATARWSTLPDGDHGISTPVGGGPIAEEHSFVVLSDGSFFDVFRTIDGSSGCAYSRDGGHHWEPSQYMSYADGRQIRHPRAANFVWKCENGNYLYWFHNHAGKWYDDRNPVWLAGGVEADSPNGRIIRWSQPEIIIYDDDPMIRMSYPDLIEENGRYYVTETQKALARVHEIPAAIPEALWRQLKGGVPVPAATVDQLQPTTVENLELPEFVRRNFKADIQNTLDCRAGFSLLLHADTANAPCLLADNLNANGGLRIELTAERTLRVTLSDGRTVNSWESDEGMLTGELQQLGLIVDGGPKIIMMVIDGKLCDGGGKRQFGWGRFSPALTHCRNTAALKINSAVRRFRAWPRALLVSEIIAAQQL